MEGHGASDWDNSSLRDFCFHPGRKLSKRYEAPEDGGDFFGPARKSRKASYCPDELEPLDGPHGAPRSRCVSFCPEEHETVGNFSSQSALGGPAALEEGAKQRRDKGVEGEGFERAEERSEVQESGCESLEALKQKLFRRQILKIKYYYRGTNFVVPRIFSKVKYMDGEAVCLDDIAGKLIQPLNVHPFSLKRL